MLNHDWRKESKEQWAEIDWAVYTKVAGDWTEKHLNFYAFHPLALLIDFLEMDWEELRTCVSVIKKNLDGC